MVSEMQISWSNTALKKVEKRSETVGSGVIKTICFHAVQDRVVEVAGSGALGVCA